ncbi:M14 family zinc carboxypeptidase [Bradyrhizobium sp. DASA03076]|uniref:M14 family zinc carboxypeptidase n=1 Tax=Bradyrhizobium sp. BLXBL-03 TaxID=3395916 RepID=UPI003F6E4DFB
MSQSSKFFRCALPTDDAAADVVRHLQEQGLLCADHALRCKDNIVTVLSEAEIALLKDAGVAVDIRAPLDCPPVNPGYLDAPRIDAAFAALNAAFPAITELTDLPELTTGYDGTQPSLNGPATVKLFRITTNPSNFSKPALLIIAGLHAREWAPPLAAIEFASQLLNQYAPGSDDPEIIAINEIVDGLDILFVGAANPDGINYSHHDDCTWRKNRRPNAQLPSCPGADVNRNFSIYWGQSGSSGDPCSYYYHGPSPFSEPEARNIRYIVETFPNILSAIDCHSAGEHIYRPQPTGGIFVHREPVSPDDDAIYVALETAMNASIAAVTPGKTYGTGSTSNHAGTFDEYAFFGHRIFGFELEIGRAFQPPIADARLSVQEAAAAMRSLAHETLALAARFVSPATVVHVIDKSSSMIASGYVDATRSNVRRIVDLMSLNDSTGIVSFNEAAAVELPLTIIASPGDYTAARSAVSAIAFGGATSIGAGIQCALGVLAADTARRSLLLISDGYENAPPTVASILPLFPADVPIHTIALGSSSNQALLQHIAATTGGTYFFSPDELGLFQIYNVAHGVTADADMAMEETIPGFDIDDGSSGFRREILVDDDADFLDVSIAARESGVALEATLRSISSPHADLSRIARKRGSGYLLCHLKRPPAGIYELRVTMQSRIAVTCSVAAYVRSPLRLHLARFDKPLAAGSPLDLSVAVLECGNALPRLSLSATVASPLASVRLLAKQWNDNIGQSDLKKADRLPREVEQAQVVGEHFLRATGQDPFSYRMGRVHLVHPGQTSYKDAATVIRAPTTKTIDGTYTIRVDVTGRTSRGTPFARVGYRSVFVGH